MVATVSGMLLQVAQAQQADTTPPATPTGISASLQSSSQIYVSWSSSTDNVGVEGYYLYRNGGFVANIPGYTYYIDSPKPGLYSYTVASYDAAGNISPQSSATPTVAVVADTQAPTAPTGLTASVTSSTVTLSWTGSTDDVAVVGYYISRNSVRISTPTAITDTSYTDTGLVAGHTYQYSVTAYDAAGNISTGAITQATTIFDITPPSTPRGLLATITSPTDITLIWQPSTDNIQVAGYNIFRNDTLLTTIPSSTAPTYDDGGLSLQTTYTYMISAFDEVGNTSGNSVPVNATTPAPDFVPPTVPPGFSASALSSSEILLTWQPSKDNIAVTGYNVFRDGQEIGTVASTSYLDTGLSSSTTYAYQVSAHDGSGNTSGLAGGPAMTMATDPVTPAATTVTPPPAPIVSPNIPPTPTATTAPSPTPTIPIFTNGQTSFTTNMYYGLRNANVTALQTFLIQGNYLGAGYATGFYGSLTQKAVQSFQCAQNIVCSGSPATTGYGSVGPRTRSAINALL